MKKRLSTRVLSLLLVAALLMGLASPAAALGNKSSVTITQVDPGPERGLLRAGSGLRRRV